MTINKNLRDLRQISGMTQEEVASRVGLTRQAISSYESGRTEPDLDMLIKLAGLYQADVSDILYGSSHAQRKLHTVRGIAAAVFGAVLLLLFSSSTLLLFMNTCLPAPADGLFRQRIHPWNRSSEPALRCLTYGMRLWALRKLFRWLAA